MGDSMNRSFIDDNGNPCDEFPLQNQANLVDVVHALEIEREPSPVPMYRAQEESGESGGNKDNPPKYFINAAELSEEENFIASEQLPSQNIKAGTGGESDESKKPPPKSASVVTHRSRVPVSKSYPDIVQTTFNNTAEKVDTRGLTGLSNFKDLQKSCYVPNTVEQVTIMAKENSDLESLVADSLENLVLQTQPEKESSELERVEEQKEQVSYDNRPIRPFDKGHSMGKGGGGIMESSAFMTESQLGGILAEKAPESWVIDLNSLSMDSEMTASRRGCGGGGSGANSLAFFVNMSANQGKDDGRGESLSSSIGPEKKIFSMFVDLKEDQGASKKSQIPNLKKPAVINKPVHNVMETSTGSIKSSLNKKFPSPIFQHKAAAEAARQTARSDWEKQREKYFDSLEPNAMMMMMAMGQGQGQCQGGTGTTNSSAVTTIDDKESNLGESTLSNRSSLHVANVLDSSFSSSIISSMETSQPGEIEICQGGACFKLQLDLTRMFQEGINTDVNISVNGKWIKAHKCILASRSQYFAAILSGHWVEKAGNTINLDGFSYSVVQFALYHIYSGTNEIPDTIDLLELATLTDLLGLEGLRENISQTFRVKFCHNFHRPCTGCITGVLECFPIAGNYGMDDLHRKMIKWICKHFVRIWPTKGFASLGEDLIDKCLKYSINHLSVDNILDHTLGCDQLTTTMPSLRWTETIFNIVNQLAEACIQFVGENLSDVLQSQKFLQFGKGQAWNISRIEGTFMTSMTLLKPDIACLSHTALSRLIELGTETIDEVEWSTGFVDFLKLLRDEVEKFLYANASKAVLSKCWEELSPAFRKKICSSSFVGYDKFGNKIVKNNTSNATSSSGGGSSNKAQRSGVGGSSTTSRSGGPKSVTQGSRSHSSAKVASVRPMQSQIHRETEVVEDPEPPPPPRRTLSNVGRSGTMSSTTSTNKSDATESTLSRPSTGSTVTTVSRKMQRTTSSVVDKSSSRRTSMSTASPTHSANRTPNKPLTPSAPTKSSPLLGTTDYSEKAPAKRPTAPAPGSATARNHALARQQSKPPVEPPKKTFLTNSAKAAAVSKPILKPVGKKGATPTSSVSSISSVGGCGSHSPTPISRQNSKPGSGSQASARYLASGSGNTANSSTGKERDGTFSARSSFSRVERPTTANRGQGQGQAHTAQVTKFTNPPPPRRNTYGQNSGHAIEKTFATNKPRPSSSSCAVKPTTTTTTTRKQVSAKAGGCGHGHGHSSMPPVTAAEDFQSFSESFQQDSLIMSKSTIETESSGDVKMRTLAEIGRSSTFSKDEPTILGKMEMDGSGYADGNEDYEDESFEDDEDYE